MASVRNYTRLYSVSAKTISGIQHAVPQFWHSSNFMAISETWQCAVSLRLQLGWYLHPHVLRIESLNCHFLRQTIIILPAITLGKCNRDVQMYCDELWPWWQSRSSSPLCEVCYVEVCENTSCPDAINIDFMVFIWMSCKFTPEQK